MGQVREKEMTMDEVERIINNLHLALSLPIQSWVGFKANRDDIALFEKALVTQRLKIQEHEAEISRLKEIVTLTYGWDRRMFERQAKKIQELKAENKRLREGKR